MLNTTYSIPPIASCNTKADNHATNTFKIRILRKQDEEEQGALGIKELFRIICIKKGTGVLYVDMRKYTISSDTVYCVKPGQAVRFEPDEVTYGYTISFPTDFLAMARLHPISLFSIMNVESSLKPEMLEIAEKMITEFSNAYAGKEEILRGLMEIFMVYLNRQQEQPRQQFANLNQAGLASMFFSLLEKNFANRKMVSDYAGDLSVTPNYLNEIVKRASGFPASHHIQQRIILEAKRKAVYVRTSMKEIAYALGFDDISHFSKYFKKASGVSFTDFKKEISQNFSFGIES
jgi:AraC family transcriptional activator of pobA